MDFVNHTPFPAQPFQAIDQFGQEFHVFTVRQTFNFGSGELRIAEVQPDLCATDIAFDDSPAGSVEQESDYVPFKPRCDVIVNATAHPPARAGLKNFPVRLCLWRHGEGKYLIDKELVVHGRRVLCRRCWPARATMWVLKWCTLTLLRPCPWRIRLAGPCVPVPVRYEHAYGGECVVDADSPASRRVPKKARLTAEQVACHPETSAGRAAPIAHVGFDPNPTGTGFAQAWYLRAARRRMIDAPSIERPGAMLKARQFWRWLAPARQAECEASPFQVPAGFGSLPKGHPERRALVGTVDDAFIAGDAPLPDNFDFAIWNSAPADQQIDYPSGGEEIELANLCAAGSPGTRTDEGKNVYLRLRLPGDQCVLHLSDTDGRESILPMVLDTILVEPEAQLLTLVWRRTIPFDDMDVSSVELHYGTPSALERKRFVLNHPKALTSGADHG
ncbi:DUF2169 family type VI secretion system accessory protein [Pseudoduganella albidiflava]|uniref:DUF2169 domain-containing protein n=1 Tax=Pseudoduganella albidiflava TaxID=321983 RepID=A0A411WWK0_9BURK|nr:DUF2169 domain-containing protein [Pseudoduganella albidiflava]QBI01130.1 DUF2169 domain-containing protein [Pseudoduganella albidiflava]GGY48363.1 hypothetical protein GCM10007387_33170 [Pseudoduganella albidiflava]